MTDTGTQQYSRTSFGDGGGCGCAVYVHVCFVREDNKSGQKYTSTHFYIYYLANPGGGGDLQNGLLSRNKTKCLTSHLRGRGAAVEFKPCNSKSFDFHIHMLPQPSVHTIQKDKRV